MKVLDREIEKDMTVEIENVDSKVRWFGVVTRAGAREFTVAPEGAGGWPTIIFDGEESAFRGYRISRVL